jgi:hypothetical protein
MSMANQKDYAIVTTLEVLLLKLREAVAAADAFAPSDVVR